MTSRSGQTIECPYRRHNWVSRSQYAAGDCKDYFRRLFFEPLERRLVLAIGVNIPVLDWGDAPDTGPGTGPGDYATTFNNAPPNQLNETGPSHPLTPNGPRLGNTIDGELDGQPNATATGDGADEDGVSFENLFAGSTGTITVNVQNALGIVFGWIDLNRNGVFDYDERFGDGIAIAAGATKQYTLALPQGSEGNTYARVRVSTGGNTTPTGSDWDGEVEDYAITIWPNSVYISDVAVEEKDTVGVFAVFNVSLVMISSNPVSVSYATADQTARAPSDYVARSGVLTFAPGEMTKTISVSVLGDYRDENNETFLVNLSNPVNIAIFDGQGVGTILENDIAGLIINSGTGLVTTEFGGSTTISVRLRSQPEAPVTLTLSTSAPSEATISPSSLEFTPDNWTSWQPAIVTGVDDSYEDGDVIYWLNFYPVISSDPIYSALTPGGTVGHNLDNDTPPTIAIGNTGKYEGNSGSATVTLMVTLSNPFTAPVTVQFATSDQSAFAPGDYTSTSGTLTFAPGEMSHPINVAVQGDLTDEDLETFLVTLSNPTNATISDAEGVVFISDDDETPEIYIPNMSIVEGNSGTREMIFTATLSGPSSKTVSVDYATGDASATSPADYLATSGNLVFEPGEMTKTISVTVNGDGIYETNESFAVNLSNPVNATIRPNGNMESGFGFINNDESSPSFSISDTSVTESDSETVTAVFALSLSTPSYQTTAVSFVTVSQSAVTPGDFAWVSGRVEFPPGQTSGVVWINVTGDTLDEASETFKVQLSNPSNAGIADAEGIGTILDNDPSPSLSINSVSVPEQGVSSPLATFTVTLSQASGQTVTVAYQTRNQTAVSPSDYATVNSTVTFNPGQVSKTISVPIQNDAVDEPNETFAVILSNPVNATISNGQGIGTIVDDDPTPTISIGDAIATESNGTISLVVTLSAASGQTVLVDYATANQTAIAPSDYVAKTGTLQFNPGQTSQTISISKVDDFVDEPNETFVVNLSNPTNATMTDAEGVVTINDNDPTPTLVVNNVSTNESATQMSFTVTLSGASSQQVSVDYATADGSAVASNDYQAVTGTLTFNPGQTSNTILVPIINDAFDEPNETFFVNLSNVTNAILSDSEGVGTIVDNDPTPSLAVNNVIEDEGAGTVTLTVTLSAPSGQQVIVDYATADGGALAPDDYQSTAGTLTFIPGETSKSISVPLVDDALDEVLETFVVNLANAVNAAIGDSQGVATIRDDDDPPTISISDVTVTEGSGDVVTAEFVVALSAASSKTITVDYESPNGTAVAPDDFVFTSGVLTFAPGQTMHTISVSVEGDLLDEPDETFFVRLSSPSNAVMPDSSGRGTIEDDDAPPELSIDDVTVSEGDNGSTNAVFTVSLSTTSGWTVRVHVATADQSAGSPDDYSSVSTTLLFLKGETTKTVSVPVQGDLLDELNESFVIALDSPSNATIADEQGVGTIEDDDLPPELTISDVTLSEGNSGAVTAQFTLLLSAPSGLAIAVDYATSNQSAVSPDDYTAANDTLIFNAGETSKTITIDVQGDTLDESDESFAVDLSNASNVNIVDPQGIAVILDDDVTIDVKPNDSANVINLSSNVAVPVSILSTGDFDAPALVDQASIRFGKTGTEDSLETSNNKNHSGCSAQDANGDGVLDLLCYFDPERMGFTGGESIAILGGQTTDGVPRAFEGRDAVVIKSNGNSGSGGAEGESSSPADTQYAVPSTQYAVPSNQVETDRWDVLFVRPESSKLAATDRSQIRSWRSATAGLPSSIQQIQPQHALPSHPTPLRTFIGRDDGELVASEEWDELLGLLATDQPLDAR